MNQSHWDDIYSNAALDTLGWYQEVPQPDLDLIEKTEISRSDHILVVGAGRTTLVAHLLNKGYHNLTVTDISHIALKLLKLSMEANSPRYIHDDLTNANKLLDIGEINLWIDRAVLHFLTEEQDRQSYMDLLRRLVVRKGYVIFGQFSTDGATKCSGLDVYQYDLNRYQQLLGEDFILQYHEDYIYTMPSGQKRPYIYAIYQRKG